MTAQAGDVVVPGDISVTLTAVPTTRLEPGQTIHFTLSVTNNGPEPVPRVGVFSGPIYDDQITVYDGTSDCDLGTSVADGPDSYWYYREWYLSIQGEPDYPPLAVGETRICHFTESLTSGAPSVVAYSFGMLDNYHDSDPSNDVSMVYLRRATTVAGVPLLMPVTTWLLAGLLAAVGITSYRRSVRRSVRGA